VAEVVGERARPAVRIGLNAGEPLSEDGDLFGSTVQIAARVCGQAAAGEILVSDVVRQLARGKGFRFVDCGPRQLRGVDEPIRVWRLERTATEPD
jgi:adenylate cyclase